MTGKEKFMAMIKAKKAGKGKKAGKPEMPPMMKGKMAMGRAEEQAEALK